jgi:hypothetical protein
VVNALPPEFNQNVMRASLYNKANYLDMASGTIQGETIDESHEGDNTRELTDFNLCTSFLRRANLTQDSLHS